MSARTESGANFRINKNATIGSEDAASDQAFLDRCFVDTGDLDVLLDCQNPKRLAVGRTGSGKTALLRQVRLTQDHVIELPPEHLALGYVTNSNILRTLEGLGVKLDPFFKLLWRHIFAIELIRYKFHIQDRNTKRDIIARLRGAIQKDPGKEATLDYLEKWGEKFWVETDERVRELTEKIEASIQTGFGGALPGLTTTADAAAKMSEEQRKEYVQRAQQIVSSAQVKELGNIVKLLQEDVFTDPQQRYYIIIDRLDEDWVDEDLRYRLIRQLLEAIRSFQKIPPVKILCALREDLLDRVYRRTRDAGFQEEKYSPLYLRLSWTPSEIEEMLDARVRSLVKEQYRTKSLGINNILPPNQIKKQRPVKYIINRTFLRPREAIQFINLCLQKASGKSSIAVKDVRAAESEYSRLRVRALADEWHADYPELMEYVKVLHRIKNPIEYGQFGEDKLGTLLEAVCHSGADTTDPIYVTLDQHAAGKASLSEVYGLLFRILYAVGVVGVKLDSQSPIEWSFSSQPTLHSAQMRPNVRLYVHPAFFSAFGIESDDYV